MPDDPWSETSTKLAGYLTIALTAAGRYMEVRAHQQARQARDAAQNDAERTREIAHQARAELTVARHDLRDVHRKEWWDTATVDQVAAGYATARAWSSSDQHMSETADHMREEIRDRFGIDADRLVAAAQESAQAYLVYDLTPPRGWLKPGPEERAETLTEARLDMVEDRAIGLDMGQELRDARIERATALLLTAEADVVDHVAYSDGVITPTEAAVDLPAAADGWDQAGRREQLAARLEAAGVPADAAAARTATDRLQAAPAQAAVATKATTTPPKAKNNPGIGQERVRGR